MSLPSINVLWLKRDLRTSDHAPLQAAIAAGVPFVILYCFEPSILSSPKHSPRHWRFIMESLIDLRERQWPVLVYWGEVLEALNMLSRNYRIATIFSHQETSHRLSFVRDRQVVKWCRQFGAHQSEFVQDGVIRGRKHRSGFADHVDSFMALPLVPEMVDRSQVLEPKDIRLPRAVRRDGFTQDFRTSRHPTALSPEKPGWYQPAPLPHDPNFQPGGETNAWRYLRSFTADRGQGYAYKLGNPTLSRRSCSRMSTYLAYGCVSVRQVFQWSRRVDVAAQRRHDLKMFRERLWWRAHYFQKLEAEWQIEHRPINPAFESLDRTRDGALLNAFRTARTGFPMIDANLRCLEATGWINFRSRAMLVTFATFTLWLDWRPIAEYLGSRFLDYDPGIHYGQFQMQAGLTGYHAPRNYNPYKQGEQYDAEGEFVHKWLPELRNVPAPWCHYPHRLTAIERTMYGFSEAVYPAPVVDFATASAKHMDRYWAVRNSAEAQGHLVGIWLKHVLPESREKYMIGADPSPWRDV